MAGSSESNKPDIILNSPVGSKPAVFKWPLVSYSKGQKFDGAEEIIETIRWVAREYLEFKPAIENLLPDQPDLKSYDCIKSLCDKYNKIPDMVMKMNKGTSIALKTSSRASQGLLKHIIQQVYNEAIDDPSELNKYTAFSSETYGETSFEFMAQLIERDQFRPGENDVFVDLGSGVGHLVLQVAATVECKKCYGIEIADVPAGYAKAMKERFEFWMNWHGKTYSEFELFHGDFFEKKYENIIKNAQYILVNNFAFKPDVDHKLKQRFLDLKDGTKILSSKRFCLPKPRPTERDLGDLGSIMKVQPIQPEIKRDSVSWTPKPLPYYLHILDASPVEKYYQRQKRKQSRPGAEKGKSNKRRRTGVKAGSDLSSDESDDQMIFGPTTRKAWTEWCNSGSLKTSNRTSTDSAKASSQRTTSTDTENLSEGAIEEAINAQPNSKTRETDEPKKRDKRSDSKDSDKLSSSSSHGSGAQSKSAGQAPKSCLDKKRDYAIKKSSTSSLTNAPPSALYSISKPHDTSNGSSPTKIPNIVIKVKPPTEPKSNPEVEQKSTRAKAASGSTATKQRETKPVDENGGKKLRQRRKSTLNQTDPQATTAEATHSKTSTSTAKSGSKQTVASSAAAPITGPRARKATVKAAAGATKGPTANVRKATSPDKNFSIDLLHAKTVESYSSNISYNAPPAPGCEDHNLESITETPSLPKVVIKDASMFTSTVLSQRNIDRLFETTKNELAIFTNKLQQPHARDSLLRSIDHEKLRNRELLRNLDELTRHNRFLHERILKSLKIHCDEFNIKNSARNVVGMFGALLKRYQDLSTNLYHLTATIQPSQPHRAMDPPAAHSNSSQSLPSPYRVSANSATLDLSLK